MSALSRLIFLVPVFLWFSTQTEKGKATQLAAYIRWTATAVAFILQIWNQNRAQLSPPLLDSSTPPPLSLLSLSKGEVKGRWKRGNKKYREGSYVKSVDCLVKIGSESFVKSVDCPVRRGKEFWSTTITKLSPLFFVRYRNRNHWGTVFWQL